MINVRYDAKISNVIHNLIPTNQPRPSRGAGWEYLYLYPTNFLLFGQMKKKWTKCHTSLILQ